MGERLNWEPDYGACDFYTTSSEGLAHALEAIRRKVCAYMTDPCDCKYGISVDGTSHEQTGCPELRELIHRLLHRPETLCDRPSVLPARAERAFASVARALITSGMDERMQLAWERFRAEAEQSGGA